MQKQRWLIVFLSFGFLGCLAEIVVGMFHAAVFGLLWIYYNGFYTSIESFFYFGGLGTLEFKGFLMLLDWKGYKIVKQEEGNKGNGEVERFLVYGNIRG